jgi:hypothetical protein
MYCEFPADCADATAGTLKTSTTRSARALST